MDEQNEAIEARRKRVEEKEAQRIAREQGQTTPERDGEIVTEQAQQHHADAVPQKNLGGESNG